MSKNLKIVLLLIVAFFVGKAIFASYQAATEEPEQIQELKRIQLELELERERDKRRSLL